MKRVAVGLSLALGISAAFFVALQVASSSGRGGALQPTGSRPTLTMSEAPEGIEVASSFQCVELRNVEDDTFTVRAEGGSVRNISTSQLEVGLELGADFGGTQGSTKKAFLLYPDQNIKYLYLYPVTSINRATSCWIKIVDNPSAEFSGAKGSHQIRQVK